MNANVLKTSFLGFLQLILLQIMLIGLVSSGMDYQNSSWYDLTEQAESRGDGSENEIEENLDTDKLISDKPVILIRDCALENLGNANHQRYSNPPYVDTATPPPEFV